MNKKILIGSIIAVFILIMVSFTGVVGYQTTKSSTIARASPLFAVRSSRAIDEESKDFSCDYVGKGELNNIYLPERNDKTDSVDNLIYAIQKMDDESLRKLTFLLNYQLRQTDDSQELNYNEIYHSLKGLKNTPYNVLQHIQQRKGTIITSNIHALEFTMDGGDLLCNILLFLFVIAFIPLFIFMCLVSMPIVLCMLS